MSVATAKKKSNRVKKNTTTNKAKEFALVLPVLAIYAFLINSGLKLN